MNASLFWRYYLLWYIYVQDKNLPGYINFALKISKHEDAYSQWCIFQFAIYTIVFKATIWNILPNPRKSHLVKKKKWNEKRINKNKSSVTKFYD